MIVQGRDYDPTGRRNRLRYELPGNTIHFHARDDPRRLSTALKCAVLDLNDAAPHKECRRAMVTEPGHTFLHQVDLEEILTRPRRRCRDEHHFDASAGLDRARQGHARTVILWFHHTTVVGIEPALADADLV